MTEMFVYTAVVVIAAAFGATAGRVFAVEAESSLTAIFTGPYVGAGVGLMSGTLIGSPLTLVAQLLNAGSSTWFDALDVAGMAVLWGTASGAASGLAVSMVIVAFNLRTRQQS